MEKSRKLVFHFLDNKKNGEMRTVNGITYMPIYYSMFIGGKNGIGKEDTVIPEVPMPEL